MRCSQCSTDNSERRSFCRECGARVAAFCPKCGFGNAFSDKYCGGCGAGVAGVEQTGETKQLKPGASLRSSELYSREDVLELLQEGAQKKEKTGKKKDMKESDSVSQEFLDSIFDSNDDT